MKNTYLNGKLTGTIYMKQPPNFVDSAKSAHVCRLAHGLYGLWQSGHIWYQTLASTFKVLGFEVCTVDHAIFVSHDVEGKVIVAALTDNLLMISNHLKKIEVVKRGLEKHFEMTDLGEAHWLLGVEIRQDCMKRTLSLSQGVYVQTLLSRFSLEKANTVTSPMDPGVHLSKSQSPTVEEDKDDMVNVPYRELIGSLMYAAVATRPDIAHAITALSQFLENHGRAHWQAAQRVLKYLKGTADFGLTYGLADSVGMPAGKPVGYTNVDFASQEHRHSVLGYAFLIHGGAVSWSSKMQAVIALSSTEAEYIASTHAAKEAKWLAMLLSEIGADSPRPFPILADNQSAIALTKDNAFHSRTKHIDIPYHYVREAVEKGNLRLNYVQTDSNLANIFTKPLGRAKLEMFSQMLGLSWLPNV